MTFGQAYDDAKARGLMAPGRRVERRPARWPVGHEFGGKYFPRRRVVAILGLVTGLHRGKQEVWVLEELTPAPVV